MFRKVVLLASMLCLAGLSIANPWDGATANPMIGSVPTILAQWGSDTPQPDTIRYDDPAAATLYPWGGVCYVSVRFTPVLLFDLRAAYIGIYVINSTAPYNVWVTGDSSGYADPNQILEMVSNITSHNGWNQVDFADTHQFVTNQNFHIVAGPFQATLQYGPGTYPQLDSNADWLHRSYISETWPSAPPTTEISGYDWRLRAGGEYSGGDWIDLACTNVDNNLMEYFLCQNEMVTFGASIQNIGTLNVTNFNVEWVVVDEGGIVTFSTTETYGPLPSGAGTTVTAPLPWLADTQGEFIVSATVTVLGDIIPENNSKMLEQQVDNPTITQLLDYDIPNFQVSLSMNPNSGRAMEFTPCSYPVSITEIQVEITSTAGNAMLKIYGDDGTDAPDPSNVLFSTTTPLVVGNNVILVGSIPITSGSFYVAYLYSDLTTPSIPIDSEPSAGTNLTMPVMYRTYDAGSTWTLESGGDHPLRAMVSPMEIGSCELEQQISPNIAIGAQVDYYADGTMVPYCVGENHPPGPNYPESIAYMAVANNYQDCYLVYINACLDRDGNLIPGHTGQVSRVVQLDFHSSYALGLAFDRRDNGFWCGDWNTHSLYHFADVTGPGGSRIVELYGEFPAMYFGLSEMPISGLEMDRDGHSLWAVTKGDPLFPDMWLEFDVSNPNIPNLIQGPFPIVWQSGGGGGGGAAGLEYSDLLNQLVVINQNTNCVEEFQDVGLGMPTPLSACNLYYNGSSYGPALMDGPGAITPQGTYTQGHLFTIDIQWQETGPFPLNEGDPPQLSPSNQNKLHCKKISKGTPGRAHVKKTEGVHSNWVPLDTCRKYATCDTIEVKNGTVTFKCVLCSTEVKASGSMEDNNVSRKPRQFHLDSTGVSSTGRQNLFAVRYFEIIDGEIECYESAMSYHDHVGAFGRCAVGYPTSLALGNTYNRFLGRQDSLNNITRFSNHPLSVGPLTTHATGIPSIEYSVPPGEVIAFDATGTASHPPLAIFTPTFDPSYVGFPGDTIAIDFEVLNAGGAGVISLSPFSILSWQVVSCPSTITLSPGEYDTVIVQLQIPTDVEDYDSDFFGLCALLPSDSVFAGMVVHSIPPLNVTIEALAGNAVLKWRSSNNPEDTTSTQFSYQILRSVEPDENFVPVTVTTDTTWTDYGVILSNTKFFYRVTARFFD